jgi:hypothetical protein
MNNSQSTAKQTVFALSSDQLAALFDKIAASMTVIGATECAGKYRYAPVKTIDQLSLDFDTTSMPPTVYLLPAKEELVRLRRGPAAAGEPLIAAEPIALFGVHPYDLHAIALLDEVFL